jgi:predicted transposase/invertase (TIGR01784 family)
LITDDTLIPENERYHNRYRLYDAETGSEFTDLLEVNVLELPKLPEKADGTTLWDWLKFVAAKKEEDLKMLTEKNPQVGKAIAKLMVLSEDEQARMIAESREKLQRDIAAREYGAEERGRREALQQTARRLLGMGMSMEEIIKATELTPEEIRPLH